MKKPSMDLDALLDESAAAPVVDALHPAPATVTRLVHPAKPARTGTREAVPSAELVNLSFKVPPAFRKQFKTAAVAADLSQVDLLAEAFELWSKSRKQ